MRYVVQDGECGKRVYLVRDHDPDDVASEIGVPSGPPTPYLNLEQVAIDINDMLVERGLFTWKDVAESRGALTSILQLVLKRHIKTLYQELTES